MKVKVIKVYNDKNFGRDMKKGEVFEVDEARFKVLTGNNAFKEVYVEAVEEKEKIEEAVAPTPKKETAKKKTTKKKSE